MTKSGLIEDVARRTPHISKKDTEVVVNTIFDSMIEALKDGDRIEIRGFGSFQVKVREAREGRNPKTGEPVHISAKRTPFFKVGKELKEMVDGWTLVADACRGAGRMDVRIASPGTALRCFQAIEFEDALEWVKPRNATERLGLG